MTVTGVEAGGMRLHLALPPRDLAPYVSFYYLTDVARGLIVEDCLPPEWGNLRAGRSTVYEAGIGTLALRPVPAMILAGPTSRAARLRIGEGRYWGVGLLPLGFAMFLGVPASDYADRFCDIAEVPGAKGLTGLLEELLELSGSMEDGVALMNRSLRAQLVRAQLERRLPQADAIVAVHSAIVSKQSRSVASLARERGVSNRTLERFCRRNFGFNPQLLLRRQRFLRSLARFMIDPTMRWTRTLDTHYHDQAHFVRDFHTFMGMRPSQYAAMAHPITAIAVRAVRGAGRTDADAS